MSIAGHQICNSDFGALNCIHSN